MNKACPHPPFSSWNDFGEVEPRYSLGHQGVQDKRSHLKELRTVTCLELSHRIAPRDGLQKARGDIAPWLRVQALAEDYRVSIIISVTYQLHDIEQVLKFVVPHFLHL